MANRQSDDHITRHYLRRLFWIGKITIISGTLTLLLSHAQRDTIIQNIFECLESTLSHLNISFIINNL